MEDWILEKLNAVENLPTLPIVIHRFNQKVANPLCGVEELTAIISEDPSIYANVLKVCNSSYYGSSTGEPIDSIEAAVIRMGFTATRNVVFSTSLLNTFKSDRNDGFNLSQFWMHSMATGYISQVVYECCIKVFREPIDTSKLYLAGLLHDVGKIILQEHFPSQWRSILSEAHRNSKPLQDAEQQVLGTDHAEIGAWLVGEWTSDKVMQEIVRYHHDPLGTQGNSQNIAAIVQVSDFISNRRRIGNSGNRVSPPVNSAVWSYLRIDDDRMQQILDEVNARNIQSNVALAFIDAR